MNLTDLGNIVREIDALGGVTRRTYNDPNDPTLETSITDPLGNTTTLTYDNRGNVLTTKGCPRKRHDFDLRANQLREFDTSENSRPSSTAVLRPKHDNRSVGEYQYKYIRQPW